MSTTPRRKQTWGVRRITQQDKYPGLTVRVTEVVKGGTLHVIWKRTGQLQKQRALGRTRADLGGTEKEQHDAAVTIGRDFMPEIVKMETEGEQPSLPAPVVTSDEVLTLGRLADLYEVRGSLKASDAYRAEQAKKLRVMTAFFGPDRLVVSLSHTDADAWINHRRNPEDGERTVRTTRACRRSAARAPAVMRSWMTFPARSGPTYRLPPPGSRPPGPGATPSPERRRQLEMQLGALRLIVGDKGSSEGRRRMAAAEIADLEKLLALPATPGA